MKNKLTKILIVTAISFFSLFNNAANAQERATISGYINDLQGKETILGATIVNVGTTLGTITNEFGFYSITLPKGNVNLRYSYVGYTAQTMSFNLTKDTVINVLLSGDAQLQEIVVTGEKAEAGIASTGMGSLDIPVRMIEHTPTLLGETDLMRTIQMTPGVQQGVGGASSFFVRGGNGDENLVLLDGAPVYKIDHLFGFFSVFTPEAIKKVSFYKSSFPARYNGRTSSVMDVRTKDGDLQNYHGSVSIGLLTSRINFEGPIVKDKTAFNISARTTYFSAVATPFMPKDSKFSYWFYDLNAKINHKFSDKDRLFFGLYNGQDKYHDNYEDDWGDNNYHDHYGSDMKWGNTIPSLRWNHVFSQKLFSNTTISYNHYRMNLSSFDEETNKSNNSFTSSSSTYGSEIIDWGASSDFDFMPSPKHSIKFGINYLYHDFAPETTSMRDKYNDKESSSDSTYSTTGKEIYAHELSLYIEDNWKLTDFLHVNPGFAYTVFSVEGKSYHNYQPRLSVKYIINSYWNVKASFTMMSQCVHMLSSTPIAMPTDLWVPITKDIKPEHATQYSVGAYCTRIKGYEFSLEGYFKEMDNVLEYKDGMSYMGFSGNWNQLVAMGEGTSKGVEFMARKTSGALTGMVSYTLSKSDRKFDRGSGVNNGEKFPFTYDRRHNFNIALSQEFNERIQLDVTWMFYSGAYTSISTSKEPMITPEGVGSKIGYIEGRNNYHLPPTHLMCIGINFTKQKKHCQRIWNFSVYNAYNSMNPAFVYKKEDDYGNIVEGKLTKITILPIIPSFTLTYKF
ncbi:MAG: TonB-dependent receptor [Bacteroidales bacterium]|nr:TonB-dependent receptor [Bacteroidales bacterium]